MPSRFLPSAQLSLDLKPLLMPTPVLVPEDAVSALADLLLAALGQSVSAKRMEGCDEQQQDRR